MSKFCLRSCAARARSFFRIAAWFAIFSGVAYGGTVQAQNSPTDPALTDIRRTIAEADKLRMEWKGESFRLAARKYAKARGVLHHRGKFRLEAEVLEKLGDVSALLSDYKGAIVHYNQALPLILGLKEERWEAAVLTKVGGAYLEMANVKQGLPHCSRALDISNRLGHEESATQAMNCLGVASSITSDVSQAQDYFERALAVAQKIKIDTGLALTHLNLGYLHANLGNMDLALGFYKSALTTWEATNEQQKRASTLTAMAGVYAQQGEKQTAFDLHNQALTIFKTIGHRDGEAAALNGIGYLYDILGDPAQAIKCYTRAFQLYASIDNQHYAAVTLGYVGRVHSAIGDHERALETFYRKLAVSRVVQDRRMESYTLKDIGIVLSAKGQAEQALEQYRQALALSQDVKDRRGAAHILISIGALSERLGDRAEALRNYEHALSLMQAVADRRGEVLALISIAGAKRDLGRLNEARRDIEKSLELIEKLRTKVYSPSLRISYLETVYRHYEFYVDLLMRAHNRDRSAGYATLALEVNEHARARTLLENLRAARTDIRQGVDPQLLLEERQLQQRLNEKAEQQTRLLSHKISPEREAAIRNEVESLLIQYKEVESRVREKSPKYAALTQPRALNLSSIQKELDEETVLLEYALGAERSYLWAVTKNSVASFELPSRAKISPPAKTFYDALSWSDAKKRAARQSNKGGPSFAAYQTAANELSAILLEPIAHLISGKRLVIVTDGILQYVPFAALPDPVLKTADGSRVPLVVDHEIVTLPSISTLAVLRNELRGRALASKTLAVIADPVFQKDDPRVLQSRLHARSPAEKTVASLRASPDEQTSIDSVSSDQPIVFERLPFSLEEAQAILEFTPKNEVMRAVGFDASLKTALDPEIRQYRIIHFATHALLNNSHPELSGIVLSLVDEAGQPRKGFLRLNEIYNLNLSAELVVLSACQTGLGKETRGEGLIGLTRGFMYAGVPRVVATLWRINDRAAAEFMRSFYEAMLRQHQSPSKALRTAQIKMWQMNKTGIPHHWAAFILQGEWH